jgi:diacylglycerol kinase (ATP)
MVLSDMALDACIDGFDVVVAAGGDGTVHEVALGLMRAQVGARSALAVVPMGTGNDFARTLALPLNDPPAALARALTPGAARPLDLIRVYGAGFDTWAVNACAGGFGGEVDEAMTPELKSSWGTLAYLIGAVRALPELKDYDTRMRYDEGPEERVEAFNVVVANGRTAAGGRPAAPLANPEDGLLEIVVVLRSGPIDIARLAARVFAGDYLSDPQVIHRRARRLEVRSRPGMWFNVDGELLSKEPLTFEAVPGALRVVVGEEYVAEPRVGKPGGA